MDRLFVKELLRVPTCSRHEDRMVEFISTFAIKHKIPFRTDDFGNIYLLKGTNNIEHVPCVVAHIDTVHHDQKDLVVSNTKLNIVETTDGDKTILRAYHPETLSSTGIGGDDLCGVGICLELILKFDNIIGAFFRQEENGCHGSRNSDREVMSKVAYAIQFDAPTNNWVSEVCSGVKLYDSTFIGEIKDILTRHGQTNFSRDPYTDVKALRELYDFNCINFFAGYYNMHRSDEYVVLEDMEKAIDMGEEVIKHLGNKKYIFNNL